MGRHGNKQQVTQREVDAHRLHREGRTQQQIAAELGVSQPGVSRILARIDRRALATMVDEVERVRVRQTSQLAWLAAEALKAGHLDHAAGAIDSIRSLWPACPLAESAVGKL